jgi:hypothetical protein
VSWQEYAVCVDYDPEMFFDPDRVRQAQSVCGTCPVMKRCREFGKGQAAGVWGGRVRSNNRAKGTHEFLLKPHGTEAAQARHRRAGEPLCAVCAEKAVRP